MTSPSPAAVTLFIGDGYVELEGRIGENAAHSHLAFQLTIGLDGPVQLIEDGRPRLATAAVLVAPNTTHRIGPIGRRVHSLYVEPQLARARAFSKLLGTRRMMGCDAAVLTLADSPEPAVDGRASRLRALIESAPPEQGPRDWAKAANLSPSRFRALCVDLLGAPPVRVRQWGRLKVAGRELAAGAGLAEAAAAAGYADQSHFTRQLRRWFGVSPARGLASLSVRVAA